MIEEVHFLFNLILISFFKTEACLCYWETFKYVEMRVYFFNDKASEINTAQVVLMKTQCLNVL